MASGGEDAEGHTKIVQRIGNLENLDGRLGELFKVVLIGETGSGKTTFVELLKNFTRLRSHDFQPSEIRSFISSGVERSMSSDTTTCSTYRIDIGEFMIDIIDTPGLADTRGEEQNKENIANIIAALKEADYVNCVCLVINGTQSRLTSLMKKVMSEIKSTLSPEVVDNFIVILTKCDIYSSSFEVSNLEQFGLSIKPKHFFTFDNPYARWDITKNSGVTRCPQVVKSEFEAAFKTLKEILSTIKPFKCVMTLKFGELREIIDEIEQHLPGLFKLYEDGVKVEEIIDNFTRKPNKVCSSQSKKVQFTPGSRNVICTKSNCNSNCHKLCSCRFAGLWTRRCVCFKNGVCKKCGHESSFHENKDYAFIADEVEGARYDDHSYNKNDVAEQLQTIKEKIESKEKLLLQELGKLKEVAKNFSYAKEAIELVEGLKKRIERIPMIIGNREIVEMLNEIIQVSPCHHSGERNQWEEMKQEQIKPEERKQA